MLTYAGVAGWPVAHSRSPAMFGAAFEATGLADWRYSALPLTPERFAETVCALPGSGYRGLNVTIPHKEAALALATDPTPAARAIGAANSLTFEDGAIEADNTDAPGLLAALGDPPAGKRCLILGAGGSARAAAWALREGGAAEVAVWNRTAERAAALAGDLGVAHEERPRSCDVLVNCTAVGLKPGDSAAELPLAGLDPPETVIDLVYGEEPPVTAWARAAGSRVIDGIEVLVRQGAASFERWTGVSAPVENMRDGARMRWQPYTLPVTLALTQGGYGAD